jgi:tetratricopeptide (TPR) repeat protein
VPKTRGNSIDAEAVRAEMESILASPRFVNSRPLSLLLRFLVEHAVAGDPPPGEYAIALEVFGRPGSFVAQLDPVVRVQHRRLRAALEEYYEAKGSPRRVMLRASARGFGLAAVGRTRSGPVRRPWKTGKLLALAALLVLAAVVALWLHFRPPGSASRAAPLDVEARALRAKGTVPDVAESARLFEQAVAVDSGYAPAWSGLADVLLIPGSSGDMSRSEAIARAREAAAKAIRLDPRNGEAHAVMGYVQLFRDSNWAGAEPEFRQAIQFDPAAPRIHRMYAQALMSRGRFDEAIAQSRMAASLDPAGSPPATDLAEILSAAHRYDEAIAEARRLVQQTGGDASAHLALGIVLSAAHRYDEAIPELQSVLLTSRSTYAMARLGYVYGAKGDRVAATASLQSLDRAFAKIMSVDWSYRALVYAGLGDNQHAVDCLEQSLANQEGDINFIGVEPAYDGMRADPRFVALRKRIGLP